MTNTSIINYNDEETRSKVRSFITQNTSNKISELEFDYFMEICKQTKLNPVLGEIYCIPTKSGLQIMTGLRGYFKIANNHPQFDGMESSLILDDMGKLIGAKCSVYRKDRSVPYTNTVYIEEFKQNSFIWKDKPKMMLLKVAKSFALRESFPNELNGTYTEEEFTPTPTPKPITEEKNPLTKQEQEIIDNKMLLLQSVKNKTAWGYDFKDCDEDKKLDIKNELSKCLYITKDQLVWLNIPLLKYSKFNSVQPQLNHEIEEENSCYDVNKVNDNPL